MIGRYQLTLSVTCWITSSLTVLCFWMSEWSPFPLLCLYFRLNHQITACLPSQVSVCAASGWHPACALPEGCPLVVSDSKGEGDEKLHCIKKENYLLEGISWNKYLKLLNKERLLFHTQTLSGEWTTQQNIDVKPVCLFDTCRLCLHQDTNLVSETACIKPTHRS